MVLIIIENIMKIFHSVHKIIMVHISNKIRLKYYDLFILILFKLNYIHEQNL